MCVHYIKLTFDLVFILERSFGDTSFRCSIIYKCIKCKKKKKCHTDLKEEGVVFKIRPSRLTAVNVTLWVDYYDKCKCSGRYRKKISKCAVQLHYLKIVHYPLFSCKI